MSNMLSKSKLAVATTLLALGILTTVYLGLAPAHEGATPGVQADKQPGKPAAADERAKAGRLYLHRNFTLATIEPDGQRPKDWTRIPGNRVWAYQSHSARLSPDGKFLAFGLAAEKRVDGRVGIHPPSQLQVWEVGEKAEPQVVVDDMDAELHNWVWSPDGGKLAFSAWDSTNRTRNWIVDVKTKKLTEVKLPRFKHDDKEYAMGIEAWSPDGAWLLAIGDGLHLVKTDGSAPRRLVKDAKDILVGTGRFSPDGRYILFAGLNPPKDKDQRRHAMTLYTVSVKDGTLRAVTDVINFGDIHAAWSPDSRRIAYCARLLNEDGTCAGETNLYISDIDGKNTVTVLTEKHQPDVLAIRLTDWR